MISRIKNLWLRRAVIIIASPFLFTAAAVIGAGAYCVDLAGSARDAWYGR